MEEFLCQLVQIQDRIAQLKRICKENNLGTNFLCGFNINKMREIYARLKKHYQENPQRGKTLWFQCELKLFKWVLICYSLLKDKKINNFEDKDWEFFRKIFLEKDHYTFKFESKRLITKRCQNLRNWSSKQDEILAQIMKDSIMMNKWSEVARIFYEKSGQKYFRTSKQCRQHWMNHLDPSKEHGQWNLQEDLIILRCVILNGKKWSIISKSQLPHRTEHMIKNRFKSLLNRHKKTQLHKSGQEKNYIKNILKHLIQNQKDQKEVKIEIKEEEASISLNLQSFQASSDNLRIKKEEEHERKIVVSNQQNFNGKLLIKDEATMQEICPSMSSCITPNFSPLYSISPSMLGLIYQPPIICLPFSFYETFWTANMNGISHGMQQQK